MACRTERICFIGDSRYLVGPSPVESITVPKEWSIDSPSDCFPMAVLRVDGSVITASWIRQTIRDMLASDDVLCDGFLSHIFFCGPPESSRYAKFDDDDGTLSHYPNRIFYDSDLSSGPYVLVNSGIHRVLRLFEDSYRAFMYGTYQLKDDDKRYRRIFIDGIPVPSRHYSPRPSLEFPLSGKRVAVKDIYDIRGLKTSCGSRAFEEWQGEATKTADAIQKLIDLGAIIVGKTKTTPFASGMGPRDWIDYQCPFNPRGDTYLDSDCSSSGSAAAVAGYDWLDISIGSDSLGSITGPAAACGIFGLRPSHGQLSNHGGLVVSLLLDTPGFFCHDVVQFGELGKAWLGGPESILSSVIPQKILYPTKLFELHDQQKLAVMDDFIKRIEKISGRDTLARIDIQKSWKANAPHDASSKPIHEFLETTLETIQLRDSYRSSLEFRSKYKQKFNREPYVEPLVQYKWDRGKKVTDSDYNRACEEKRIFKTFLEEHIFTHASSILVLPGGDTGIRYRDAYIGTIDQSGEKWQGSGFTLTTFSSLGGAPCVSFPIGERLYESKVAGESHYQPVSLMMLGSPGTDKWLIDIVEYFLRKTGTPLAVETGPRVVRQIK